MHTHYLPLIIITDNEGNTHIYINEVHIVYLDGRDYSSMHIIMGTRAMINVSKKLQLVTKSSTKIELILIGERFPIFMCLVFYINIA